WPWCVTSARSSPARPFPPTETRPATGRLSIAVRLSRPAHSASTARPTLTERIRTPQGYGRRPPGRKRFSAASKGRAAAPSRRPAPGPGGRRRPLAHVPGALPLVPGALLLALVPGAGVGGQRRDEGLLGHLDPADHLHPLLAILLLLQQLPLTGDVTAVAHGEHVLPQRTDVLPGDHARAVRGLDRHLELLPRDELLELPGHLLAVGVGLVPMHDRAERVHRLAVEQDVHLDQVGLLLAVRLVVEGRVAAGARLELVEEVEDDLGERQDVPDLHPVGGDVVHALELAAAVLAELHDRADVVGGRDHGRLHHGLV